MTRKKALQRLQGLARCVVEHLARIASDPTSRDVTHWVGEISSWIKQMEAVLPYAGKRTSTEWLLRISDWKATLENRQ